MSDDFLPYGRHTIEDDDVEAVVRALRSPMITGGPEVARFEAALAAAVGAPGAAAVSSGTAALHAACHAAGVGPGDEVIVPAVTFLSTASCARYLGATPIFADVDPDTGLVRPETVARRISPRTRAVIPVHLNGTPAETAAIAALVESSGAVVIEDAAHALGARDGDAPVGSCRDSTMAIFSFHPVKHVTTGEGGAVTARDPERLHAVRRFRNIGMERDPSRLSSASPGPWYYEQAVQGHNMRLSDLQAALGRSQLAKLGRFLARRRALVRRYHGLLRDLPGVVPVTAPARVETSAHHLFAVLIDFAAHGTTRTDVMEALHESGIGTQVHYIPLPLQPEYAGSGWKIGDFPGAMRYYERVLTLPLFPAMADSDVDRVVNGLARALHIPL